MVEVVKRWDGAQGVDTWVEGSHDITTRQQYSVCMVCECMNLQLLCNIDLFQLKWSSSMYLLANQVSVKG